MSRIFGGDDNKSQANSVVVPWWMMLWMVMVIVCLIFLTVAAWSPHYVSKFSNPNDTQYANRFKDINDVSQQSRQDKWIANGVAASKGAQDNVSGLTGSRDVPVFFQDFDVEMQAKGGNIYNQREGFTSVFDKDCGIPGAC